MTRKECLDKAAECVLRDRQKQYGKPEDCFETIAMMWSAYLGKIIQGWDVATMMALLKIARIKANPAHADNWCDLAGYAACGAECRQKFEAEMKKTVEDAFETFPHLKPKTDEELEFNPGDRVQFRDEIPSTSEGIWVDAEYVRHLPDGRGHIVQDEKRGSILVGDKDIRPAPKADEEPGFKRGDKVQAFNGEEWVDCRYIRWKEPEGRHVVQYKGCMCAIDPENLRPVSRAEGCEALVEKDAPQTPDELCQRIVDSNPSVYPRTPTGEELAEMAEEVTHE